MKICHMDFFYKHNILYTDQYFVEEWYEIIQYKKLLYIAVYSQVNGDAHVTISTSGVCKIRMCESYIERGESYCFSCECNVPGTHSVSPHLGQIESARPI